MGANWPYIFFALCDTFSDDFLTDWYKSVEEHGERLEHCRTHGNWLIMEMNGLTQCGILYPELARAGHWKQTGWQVLSEELSRQVYPDGFQYELTTGYHHVLVNNYERLLLVARAMKEEGPASIGETLGKAARVYWKLVRPDGKTPDINDGKADKIAPQLARIEEVIPRDEQTHWFATDGREGARPDETSLSLPYSGFVIFRTGWERGDTWALFDAAPFGRGHQHEDKLNFLLYAHGKNLLTEGGNYAYDSSRMRAYVTSTSSHNTGVVDGLGQSRRNSYRWHAYEIHRPAPMAARFSDTVDFARGIYDEGYAPEQTTGSFESCLGNPNRIAAGEAAQERCVYFIRKPGALSEALAGLDPFFILVDRFYGASPHTYETLWHVDDDPAAFFGESLEIDDISANAGESPCKMAAFRNLSLLFGGAVSDISDVFGQEEPVWQGFTARSAIQGDFRPVHCVMAKAEGENVRMITVVLPHGEKAQPGLRGVTGGSSVWDTDVRLRAGDKEVLLDEEKLQKDRFEKSSRKSI
jgi:hypothetical protein